MTKQASGQPGNSPLSIGHQHYWSEFALCALTYLVSDFLPPSPNFKRPLNPACMSGTVLGASVIDMNNGRENRRPHPQTHPQIHKPLSGNQGIFQAMNLFWASSFQMHQLPPMACNLEKKQAHLTVSIQSGEKPQ